MVDNHHAVAGRRSIWWRGIHHPYRLLAAGHPVLLLGDGLHECHPRHRRRWLLHARADAQRPGILCGHTLHVLPPGHHLRPGCAGDGSRQSAGNLPQQHPLLVEPDVLWRHRLVHRPVAVAWLCTAQTQGGQGTHRQYAAADYGRAGAHHQDILLQEAGGDRHTLHALLPHARRSAGQGLHSSW